MPKWRRLFRAAERIRRGVSVGAEQALEDSSIDCVEGLELVEADAFVCLVDGGVARAEL